MGRRRNQAGSLAPTQTIYTGPNQGRQHRSRKRIKWRGSSCPHLFLCRSPRPPPPFQIRGGVRKVYDSGRFNTPRKPPPPKKKKIITFSIRFHFLSGVPRIYIFRALIHLPSAGRAGKPPPKKKRRTASAREVPKEFQSFFSSLLEREKNGDAK